MFDVVGVLQGLGPFVLIGVFLIIFAECGLLVGLVLPGDPTLFTAGLLAATGAINVELWLVCVVVTVAAILGNLCGYWIGVKAGPAIFHRPNAKLLHRGQADKTQRFFDKHGPTAIVLARFIPLARTVITVVAGIGRMDKQTYLVYSMIGGILWATGMTLLGGLLGQISAVSNNIDTALSVILVVVVAVSVTPILTEAIKRRRAG